MKNKLGTAESVKLITITFFSTCPPTQPTRPLVMRACKRVVTKLHDTRIPKVGVGVDVGPIEFKL